MPTTVTRHEVEKLVQASEATLKIGELAKRSGVTTKAIRYYELLGLLHEPERTYSGYRLYGEKDVERLVFIKKAKGLGFSLSNIGDTLGLYDSQQAPCVHVLALVDQKIHEIDQLVSDLKEFRKELTQLRDDSSRVTQVTEKGSICGIVERGIHAKGQAALTWIESQRREKTSA